MVPGREVGGQRKGHRYTKKDSCSNYGVVTNELWTQNVIHVPLKHSNLLHHHCTNGFHEKHHRIQTTLHILSL
jgi:hypothetical protein